MKLAIVLPAYNEESAIGSVIDGLKREGYNHLIIVDDGSTDRTASIAESHGATVYQHIINRGLGGALGTGVAIALEQGSDIIVTFDSDGQHNPKDIKRLIVPIQKKQADVVIGSRLLNPKGMPLIRRIGNRGLNLITWFLFGVWVTDSQSGLRAFSRAAAQKIEIKTNRMEVSSEIIKEVGRAGLRLKEVPIKPIYTEYSMKHGQKNSNGVKIVAKLIIERLRR
jgi:UDP-N-acetylglucosamine---dolichyl-phosphate N-acetylglucosaminyltransferase